MAHSQGSHTRTPADHTLLLPRRHHVLPIHDNYPPGLADLEKRLEEVVQPRCGRGKIRKGIVEEGIAEKDTAERGAAGRGAAGRGAAERGIAWKGVVEKGAAGNGIVERQKEADVALEEYALFLVLVDHRSFAIESQVTTEENSSN